MHFDGAHAVVDLLNITRKLLTQRKGVASIKWVRPVFTMDLNVSVSFASVSRSFAYPAA